MLTINNQNDQLRAAHNEFQKRGLYEDAPLPFAESWSFIGSRCIFTEPRCTADEIPPVTSRKSRKDSESEAFDGPLTPPSTELGATATGLCIVSPTITF